MKATMNSRDRVLTALAHQQPDRVPLDFWAEAPVWHTLLNHTGAQTKRELLEFLQIDLRWADHHYTGPGAYAPGGESFENMWGERFLRQPDGTFLANGGALQDATRFDQIEAHHWPQPDWVSHRHLKEQLRRDQDYAILYGYADIWQRMAMVRGLEEMFFDMLERPDWVDYMTGRLTAFYYNDWIRAWESSRGRIDIFFLISDLGSQRGPLISLEHFRRFVKPQIVTMARLAHAFGAKLLFHSCGSVHAFIPDLIEAGVDILNPIQTRCTGMHPLQLKHEFGRQIAFHGGMDVQHLLPHGTSEEVRTATRDLIDTMNEGGGYILCPSHTLLPDIPIENIIQMYKTAQSAS
jgi:uroporphyrinogen decarboxylase